MNTKKFTILFSIGLALITSGCLNIKHKTTTLTETTIPTSKGYGWYLNAAAKLDESIFEQETSAQITSYNDLVEEYNVGMIKSNFRFCNVGPMTTQPLPRSYKLYIKH